jgi:hypothetical protein
MEKISLTPGTALASFMERPGRQARLEGFDQFGGTNFQQNRGTHGAYLCSVKRVKFQPLLLHRMHSWHRTKIMRVTGTAQLYPLGYP